MHTKARRGELITPLPAGLACDAAGHVIPDPGTAVRGAVAHLFATLAATGPATACVKAFNTAGLSFPWRHRAGPRKGEIDWKPLAHHVVLRILHNPRHAGAFTFGRHRDITLPGGKLSRTVLPREERTAFIPGAHPGYITLDQYDANRARLAANAAAHGRDRAAGPPREGPALLQGIIICGTCGLRMTVRYHQRHDQEVPAYVCQRDGISHGRRICQAIPGGGLDQRTGQLPTATLTPLAAEAALTVQAELQHHADLARRRYLAVDPANRLVADTLEADWNTALRALNQAQDTCEQARKHDTGQLTDAQKTRIRQLAADLPAIWDDPATPARERKRIARLLLTDVTVTRTRDTITAHIRLPAGQTCTLTLPIPPTAAQLRKTPAAAVTAIDELLDRHTHAQIAGILNTRGLTSGEGRPFHRLIIRNIRDEYGLRSREQRLRDAGMLTLTQMAGRLGMPARTVKTWHHAGLITGHPYNDKGQCLYPPPGPNPPTRAQGRKLSERRLAAPAHDA